MTSTEGECMMPARMHQHRSKYDYDDCIFCGTADALVSDFAAAKPASALAAGTAGAAGADWVLPPELLGAL